MNPIASYSFLPWLRQGVANTIAAADGDASVHERASIHVALQLSGDPITPGAELTAPLAQDFALYGPGDIVGIDARAVIRTEPRSWVTNFESNYLPAVDFYDEDFPWRYTPAAPDGSGLQLRPWITLLVLTEDEFVDGRNVAGRPAPYIIVDDAPVFPKAGELWAWAHVHINGLISTGPNQLVAPDMSAVLPKLESMLAANRDSMYSRLMAPRRLLENTGYHAFVVPTFETGRLAGLGHSPSIAPNATTSAWDTSYAGRPESGSYPIYFRWFFRTGSKGDFEYLVRLLKPQPVDPRVGTREMDVQDPGSNLPGITKPELGGVLRLGGALQVPDEDLDDEQKHQRDIYEQWDDPYPDDFQRALAAFVNLADDYSGATADHANAGAVADGMDASITADPDPLITAPLYGRWHALTRRLLKDRAGNPVPNDDKWVHRLNLDPRFRVPAAFGANVVETNAETYMDDAWQQIGDVLAANALIRRLHLAMAISRRWYDAHLTPLTAADPERALSLTAKVSSRVLVDGRTVAHVQSASLVPSAMTSTAMRRVVRPGNRLMRSLPFDATHTPSNLLARTDRGEVSPAPPKTVPAGVQTVDEAAGAALPSSFPQWAKRLLERFSWLVAATLALALVLLVVGVILLFVALVAGIAAVVVGTLLVGAWWVLRRWLFLVRRADSISEAGQTPASVDDLPKSPDFTIQLPGSPTPPHIGATDSAIAVRYKDALRDSYGLLTAGAAAAVRPQPERFHPHVIAGSLVAAVNPIVTIPKRGLTVLTIPPWIGELIGDDFDEVMAYPKIDLPMYAPLKDISAELFLPNINLIAANSITLVQTNQRFIEAYLVGLNHEFARKLLWREYPTDQRGSYFRQFWDVDSYIDSEGLSENPLKEKLYDIPELHRWRLDSALGQHNHRAPPGEQKPQAVLVIRGELLKKYPNTMIYAQHAVWPMSGGQIDLTQPRDFVHLTPDEELNPPHDKLRSPLYEAKVDPDIYFFGFDLTIDEAKGGDGTHPDDDPGWFFIIKERPGEPRFGLEIEKSSAPQIFDQLSWEDALPSPTADFLPANSLASVALAPGSGENLDQHNDDTQVDPAAVSAARWAYLLFRAPILVAIHAREMLR